MAVTTPDNIVTPDDGDDYALVQDLGAMADSVQEAITNWKNYAIGTDAQRLSLTVSSNPPLKEGLIWYSTDTKKLWLRLVSSWIGLVPPEDTATITPTAGSGITLSNNNLYKRNGFLLGTIDWSKGSAISHADTILTLPTGSRPSHEYRVTTTGSPPPSGLFLFNVTADGVVSALLPPSGRTSGRISFVVPIPL